MNKKLFSKINETDAVDSKFLTLWTAKASNIVIADYIRSNYFPMSYGFAAKILKNKVSYDNLEDEVSTLVLDVMSEIIETAEQGKLKYLGTAAFSTYIFAALKYGKRGKNKIYYPAEVKRNGVPAMEVYNLLFFGRYSDSEISSLIKESFQISEEEIQKYIKLACSYNEKECNRKADKKQIAVESYDNILDTAPQREQGNSSTPESEFFKEHDLQILDNALSSLNKLEANIVKGYFLEGRWKSIKDMQTDLKLKNGVYEIKKVKDKIKRNIGDDFILE